MYHLLPKWFDKYHNTAIGIANAAVPLGGSIMPIIANKSNDIFGHQW